MKALHAMAMVLVIIMANRKIYQGLKTLFVLVIPHTLPKVRQRVNLNVHIELLYKNHAQDMVHVSLTMKKIMLYATVMKATKQKHGMENDVIAIHFIHALAMVNATTTQENVFVTMVVFKKINQILLQ